MSTKRSSPRSARSARPARVGKRQTTPKAKTTTADTTPPPSTSHVLSKSGSKQWVRPKGFGRKADGTGPGRQKGTLNKGTTEIKKAIQARGPWLVERLFQLAARQDGQIAHQACKTLLLYGYGRPTIYVEIDPNGKKRYIARMPHQVSHDEWLKQMQAAGQIMDVAKEVLDPEERELVSQQLAGMNGHVPKSSVNGNGHP